MKPGQLKRTPWPRRRSALPPSGPIRRKSRTVSEFARIYGSRARVRWIASLPCLVCEALSPFIGALSRSQNAHTATGGMGYKAGFETIVPLCANHHRRYDEHRKPFDTPEAREAMQCAAAIIDARWQLLNPERAA